MVDQKKVLPSSKDEKAAKSGAGDSKLPGSASIANDTAAKAAPATPTKMKLATEIYKRMRTVKDVTRKDIIEKFVAEVWG